MLLGELGRYRPELLDRPRLVVGSRADLVRRTRRRRLGTALPTAMVGSPVAELIVSAVTGAGLPELLRPAGHAWSPTARQAEAAEMARTRPARWWSTGRCPRGSRSSGSAPGVWEIAGRAAERAVSFSDLTDDGALDEAVRRLRRLGVDRSLARAGAHDGDEVHVGEVSFTWYRDGPTAVARTAPRPTAAGRRTAPAGRPAWRPGPATAGAEAAGEPDGGGQGRLVLGHHARPAQTDEAVVGRICDEIAGLRRRRAPGGRGDLGGHRRRLVGPRPAAGPRPATRRCSRRCRPSASTG